MAEKGPRRVRFLEEGSSKDKVEDTGKNFNAVIARSDNVKFFPLKPLVPIDRTAKIEESFNEVEITYAKHIEEMFRARVAEVKDTNEESAEVKKRDEEPEKTGKKGKKGRKMKNRVLPLDDAQQKNEKSQARTESDTAGNKTKENLKIKKDKVKQ